jgi:hypothetical protein
MVAYPLVDAQCKSNPEACVKAGKLDFVSIYGEIGDEDLAFLTMVDPAQFWVEINRRVRGTLEAYISLLPRMQKAGHCTGFQAPQG